MKKIKKNISAVIVLSLGFLLMSLVGCQSGNSKTADMESEEGQFSYSIGMEVGQSLKQFGEAINIASFMAGVTEMLNESAKLTAEEAQQIKQSFFSALQQKRTQKNAAAGEAFLNENKERPEVKTTPSGLQYEVLQEGNGPRPDSSSEVTVHYVGTLLDGKEFDNSIKRGTPATFGVTGVIPGWTEALLMMNAGSKYKLYIPANLAYGERGAGRLIEPNSTLVFEVDLLEVNGKK